MIDSRLNQLSALIDDARALVADIEDEVPRDCEDEQALLGTVHRCLNSALQHTDFLKTNSLGDLA